MRNGLFYEGLAVLPQHLRIVADHCFPPRVEQGHTRGLAPQVETHLRLWNGVVEMADRLPDQLTCPCHGQTFKRDVGHQATGCGCCEQSVVWV